MHKSEYPEEAILHCKAARSQTPSLAFFLSPSFVGVWLSSLLQEQYPSFHSADTPSGSRSSLNSAIAPVGITLLLHLSGHYLPRHVFSIKETGFEDIQEICKCKQNESLLVTISKANFCTPVLKWVVDLRFMGKHGPKLNKQPYFCVAR